MPSKGWKSERILEAVPHQLPWATGRFYGSPYCTLSTGSTSRTSIRLIPVYVPNVSGVTVTSIGVESTVGAASSSVRLGLYTADESGLPNKLIIDGGTASTTGTGFASVSVSKFLRQGWFYIASTFGGGAPTVRTSVAMFMSGLGVADVSDTTVVAFFDIDNLETDEFNINGLPGHIQSGWTQTSVQLNAVPRLMVGI